MLDLFGKAILDYQTGNNPEDLITETSISETDEMSVAYLFRSFEEMPKIEQKALELSKGKILDVGCGAGSHSLYLQNEKGLNVTAIDISENAIKACKLRGLKNAKVQDVMRLDSDMHQNDEEQNAMIKAVLYESNNKYDTILLLMNGAGMCGRLKNLEKFLTQLKSLLTENGQILLDSSDIIYMFDDDDSEGSEGGKWIPADMDYYGELVFDIQYKGEKEVPFDWMYIDYNTLQNAAHDTGFQCELILEGEHFDYLARLTKRNSNS
jgi:SAM-dependent methyltransferase